MGLEVECKVRHEGRTSNGKARLEATDLTFRGDFRLTIPLGRITSLEADDGELAVEFDGGEAIFELGAAAEKWARAIKKPKSRLDKLGVKTGLVVSVIGVEERSFVSELKRRNIELSVGAVRDGSDLIFTGAESRDDLGRLEELKRLLKEEGAIWVVRPKGKGGPTEAEVIAAGKQVGLVDVKVVAFSETHTAEKFMIPAAARPSSPSSEEATNGVAAQATSSAPEATAAPAAPKEPAPAEVPAAPPPAPVETPAPTVSAAPVEEPAPTKSAPAPKAAAKKVAPAKKAAPAPAKQAAPPAKQAAPVKVAAPAKQAAPVKAAAKPAKKAAPAPAPAPAPAKKKSVPPKAAAPAKPAKKAPPAPAPPPPPAKKKSVPPKAAAPAKKAAPAPAKPAAKKPAAKKAARR